MHCRALQTASIPLDIQIPTEKVILGMFEGSTTTKKTLNTSFSASISKKYCTPTKTMYLQHIRVTPSPSAYGDDVTKDSNEALPEGFSRANM